MTNARRRASRPPRLSFSSQTRLSRGSVTSGQAEGPDNNARLPGDSKSEQLLPYSPSNLSSPPTFASAIMKVLLCDRPAHPRISTSTRRKVDPPPSNARLFPIPVPKGAQLVEAAPVMADYVLKIRRRARAYPNRWPLAAYPNKSCGYQSRPNMASFLLILLSSTPRSGGSPALASWAAARSWTEKFSLQP